MPWIDDLVTLVEEGGVASVAAGTLTTSTKATLARLPYVGSGALLSIIETSGSAPERTQNSVIRPAYLRPAAQFMARAFAYEDARALAQAAYNEVVGRRNVWITSPLSSGWYREINPLQEPFDAGVDDRKMARCAFNVVAVKRPDGDAPDIPFDEDAFQ